MLVGLVVGLAALIVAGIGAGFLQNAEIFTIQMWRWMEIANFSVDFAF